MWVKLSQTEIKDKVFSALSKNIQYEKENILGIPASYLDEKVFNQDASFLKDAPFISTLIQNPNHIGCHTLGHSEPFFEGTQAIEKELLDICAVDILKGTEGEHDGYLASGGTEANIQAMWIYRNYFQHEMAAANDEICIICSYDSHYSMEKAGNLLSIDIVKVPVVEDTRLVTKESLETEIRRAKKNGKKYFIVVCNMMTTMFGSVDNVNLFVDVLNEEEVEFKLHVDGAFGGFYYPFSKKESSLTFENEYITSFTLDAHKMAQAPYGTGIFLIRKNMIHHVNTEGASYVKGLDYTLIGSRSGANAVATWMILVKNGPYGWKEKIFILQARTDWMCEQLNSLGKNFYSHPKSNIITVRSKCVSKELAEEFGLVPDNHDHPNWYKLVIMEHVTIEKLLLLVNGMKEVLEMNN